MVSPYKYQDITTLIQGPRQDNGPDIETYLKYGPVVLSSWTDSNQSELQAKRSLITLPMINHPGVKHIVNPLPSRNREHCLVDSTFYWAICSMYHGLKNVETKYVVKTRSDERFSELEPFIEPFLLDDKKMVCGNIFVQKFALQQFHIGDHIFVAKTETLLDAVSTIRNIYNGNAEKYTWAEQGPYSAEQVLAFAFLNSNGVQVPNVINGQEQPGERDIFHENFYVVDISKVSDYKARWNHARKTYDNNFINPHGVATMEDI